MARRTAAEVADDRAQTLDAAVSLASRVGLEGVTIGGLAEQLGMSKSGLVGRFGSKERLQLATLEQAVGVFRRVVYDRASGAPAGLPRLGAICDAWLQYLGDPPFPGGCFLTTASVEFDARPGPVNDAVRRIMALWLSILARHARIAVEHGDLPAGTEPEDIAFALNALAVGTNCEFQLHRSPATLGRGRRAMAAVLGTDPAGAAPA